MADTPYEQAIRATREEIQRQETAPAATDSGWRLADGLALVALLAAIGFMFWILRWSRGLAFGGGRGREMVLMDRLAIGRQSTLLVVRLRGRDYWLADHDKGVTLLATLSPPEEPPSPADTVANPTEARATSPEERREPPPLDTTKTP